MRIATWNVNSLRVRLPQLLDWLRANPVDVLGLQELKLQDDDFPRAELESAGYHAVCNGQKTYNGVALLSREPTVDVSRNMADFLDDQRRVIAATVAGVRVVNIYVPNGQAVGSDKYAYKLRWLAALQGYLHGELQRHPQLALIGDFNIAPADIDVHDPAAWRGKVLFSDPERAAFHALLAIGLQDAYRLQHAEAGGFTWWDYRQASFRRNLGLRIDHVLLSAPLALRCRTAEVDLGPRRQERPSDHAPVVVEIDGGGP